MTHYPRRTDLTRQICAEHWDDTTKRDPCYRCPLISACHRPTPAGLEAYTRHITRLNEAAYHHSQKSLGCKPNAMLRCAVPRTDAE